MKILKKLCVAALAGVMIMSIAGCEDFDQEDLDRFNEMQDGVEAGWNMLVDAAEDLGDSVTTTASGDSMFKGILPTEE